MTALTRKAGITSLNKEREGLSPRRKVIEMRGFGNVL